MGSAQIAPRPSRHLDPVAFDHGVGEQLLAHLLELGLGLGGALGLQVELDGFADAHATEPFAGDASAWGNALANDHADADHAIGRSIGAWKIVGTIGRGGMGAVDAVQRGDGAGPHTLEASRLKAYTSASAKNTTLAIMEGSQKNPAAANLGQIPGYLLLGGGVPVKVGNEVIGAVGVGGAPGGHLDEQCAVAGIAKVQDLLK